MKIIHGSQRFLLLHDLLLLVQWRAQVEAVHERGVVDLVHRARQRVRLLV